VFEFLFKYRPVVFERGDLSLALPMWAFLLALLASGLVVVFALDYRRIGPSVTTRDRWILTGLRAAAFSVLVFVLFRPILLVSTVVPRRNFVAVLLDDSQSMRVADEGDGTRAQRILEWFASPTDSEQPDGGAGTLRRELEDRFRLRLYGFSSDADRVDGPEALAFDGSRTSIGGALERVGQEMAGLPLSGIVVVSDGADNDEGSGVSLSQSLLNVRATGVPVYTIGVGAERIAPDVEVRRVELPRRALEGTTIVADIIVSHAGLTGETVRLDVEDDGRIVGTRQIEFGADGEVPVQVQFTVENAGPRTLRFVVAPLDGEALTENNERRALLDVTAERQKVLYFEGSPRPEHKFIRRAVAEDENLQLVSLLRTADEKFLRLDVDDGEELAGGFPTTREELYSYAGLILGSVEASFFTHDQLQMMADFVGQRGGGLLVLGGRRSLGEGGYAGTPLADALPILLEAGGEPDVLEVLPQLTPAGRRHSAMRIAEDESGSAERWGTLPAITSVNRVHRVKPGAVTLLNGQSIEGNETRVLLAHQRYGRGTAIAFTTQDSWLWQMHADIPLEDQTHETLWRQIIRWLVHDVPGRARLDLNEDAAPPGEPFEIRATVEDERYLRVNGAEVAALVTSPTGVIEEVSLEWTVERDGEYSGRFVPAEPGLHRVDITATATDAPADVSIGESGANAGTPGEVVGGSGYFRAGSPRLEQFGAGRRTELLRRIADETGGRFYASDEAETLADEIQYTESGDTVYEERPLWDMPILFLVLALLLGGEWGFRRWRDLA